MTAEDNKDIARRFLEAGASGDVETIVALLAEDVTWWVPRPFGERIASVAGVQFPASGIVSGRDAVLSEFVGPIQALFVPGAHRVRIDDMVAEGDKVVVLMHIDGEVATGGEYHNDFSLFFEIRNGQIASVREYLDTLYVIETVSGG